MAATQWPPPDDGYILTPPRSLARNRENVRQIIQNYNADQIRRSGNSYPGTGSLHQNAGDASPPFWNYPVPMLSIILGIIQVILFFSSGLFGINCEEDVGVSWDKVVTGSGYWRVVVGHYFHFGRLTLILNVISLYCFGRLLERKIQLVQLFVILQVMGIGSNILFLLANVVFTGAMDSIACGFSHIHFGLRILLAYTQEPRNYEPSLFLGLYPAYLSPIWAPWQPLLEVTLLKLILPELNVTGQFSGILMGFLISFLLKIFPSQFIYTQEYVKVRHWRRD